MFPGVFTNNGFSSARMETAQPWGVSLPVGQAVQNLPLQGLKVGKAMLAAG